MCFYMFSVWLLKLFLKEKSIVNINQNVHSRSSVFKFTFVSCLFNFCLFHAPLLLLTWKKRGGVVRVSFRWFCFIVSHSSGGSKEERGEGKLWGCQSWQWSKETSSSSDARRGKETVRLGELIVRQERGPVVARRWGKYPRQFGWRKGFAKEEHMKKHIVPPPLSSKQIHRVQEARFQKSTKKNERNSFFQVLPHPPFWLTQIFPHWTLMQLEELFWFW